MAGRGQDKRGRSKKAAPFVMLQRDLIRSLAWKSLNGNERAAYVALADLFDGKNNGRLALSARRLADELHISKDTAAKCLTRLVEVDLVTIRKFSGFNAKAEKHSREYRLNAFRCDVTGEPSKKNFTVRCEGHHGPASGTTETEIL